MSSYLPANRQTTPDFLVAVTDPGARIPRPGVTTQPRSADEFAQYFLTSKYGGDNAEEIEQYIEDYVGKAERADEYANSARAEFAKRSGMEKRVLTTYDATRALTEVFLPLAHTCLRSRSKSQP